MSLTVLEIMILYFYYEVTVVTEDIPPVTISGVH